ncbi:MAG TPA: GNAT family N-acetyltransferase [Vineibacter sp.]|nr:GNAT family N-acetyltransferase [Vineibacter sp.]
MPDTRDHRALVIRPATADDLPAIRSLLEQLGYTLELDEVRARLAGVMDAPGHVVLVGARAGQVIGLLHLFARPALEKPPEVIVQALVVDAADRQGGVGKAMMAAAEQWARDHGFRSIALSSHIKRAGAHAFYAALGYDVVATSHLLRKTLD